MTYKESERVERLKALDDVEEAIQLDKKLAERIAALLNSPEIDPT